MANRGANRGEPWSTLVVKLIRAHIRLGIHPSCWKVARGVTIPKPGKENYGLDKSYRVISLLNYLGKMVEKVAAMMVSVHYEATGRFHPGQHRCRVRRSAVDTVRVTIAQTQEAWRWNRITGALLMDVAAAFSSVARGCLLRTMRAIGLDENLIDRTDSFMQNRRVIMSVDGQDDSPREVTTGLPQGSPISPVLFAIYIADIHAAVEDQVEDSRGISFDDDVTWLVEGRDIGEVVRKLERCVAASLEWAESNAVRFETSMTEAILFSRKRAHRKCQAPIWVGEQTVRFAPEATWWLGIWLNSELRLCKDVRNT